MSVYTILHTIETAGPGGAENVLLNLVSNLDPERFRSLAVLPEGRWLPRKLRERGIPTITAESKGWYDTSLLRTISNLIRRESVDLIHSHLPDQNFYSCLVGRYTGRKVIVTYHGAPKPFGNGGVKLAIKTWTVRHMADSVVVVSEYLRKVFASSGFAENNLVRIYNGVCFSKYSSTGPGLLRAELGCVPSTKLVGMVANLRRSKGYEYFIRAARKVVDAIPEARFVAVGELESGIAQRLSGLLLELGLQDRFTFVGFREDISSVLSDLDVFVLSSISEGLSIATIEAMASSKPVVVTRSGGPQEIVEDGRTGYLVPPADPDSLATKIIALLRHPDLANSLGRNARKEVEKKFSLEGMVRAYERLYEQCLSGR